MRNWVQRFLPRKFAVPTFVDKAMYSADHMERMKKGFICHADNDLAKDISDTSLISFQLRIRCASE